MVVLTTMAKRSAAVVAASSSSSISSAGITAPRPCNYFLLKSEPKEFSIQALSDSPGQTSCWSGVRNHAAKNIMMSAKKNDVFLFYHSSDGKRTGIYGTGTICGEAYPDPAQFDASSPYYDRKMLGTSPERQWRAFDVKLESIFAKPMLLLELKSLKDAGNDILAGMALFKFSRLSVQSVSAAEFAQVMRLVEVPACPPTKKAKT